MKPDVVIPSHMSEHVTARMLRILEAASRACRKQSWFDYYFEDLTTTEMDWLTDYMDTLEQFFGVKARQREGGE